MFVFMDSHHEHFVLLLTIGQKPKTAHLMRGTIAAKCVNLNHSELHCGTNLGFGNLIESDTYSQWVSFYILLPATAIEVMINLPNRWNSQDCIGSINCLMGDDAISQHGI